MTEPEFAGTIGQTIADSAPWWPDLLADSQENPNVLLVVLDDTGWADLGCFGSEIATPTVDSLADRGLRYTNFHVTPLCSPTRAALLTGRNHHAVGMRFLADTDTGFPNSRGRVRPDVPMLPERMRERGYGTYLAGKWHLTPPGEITSVGPYRNWPLARGFDRFYGFLDGCTDQYAPELYEDNHSVNPPFAEGYHLSEDLADHAIRFVSDHVAFRAGQPFFLQLAFAATHAPFQVPRKYIDPYVSVFAKGWDQTRADRLRRQQELGVTPPDAVLTERDPAVPAWEKLSDAERLLFTHLQAAFAGFLEHADAQLGRLINVLGRLGVLDNTVVMVMSDNGASREGGRYGAVDTNGPYNGIQRPAAEQVGMLDRIGGPEGPAFYPQGWAAAGNTPFRRYKQFVDLGGVRSPLVVSWPQGIADIGECRRQFVHAIDLAPTVLDLADIASQPGTDGASIRGTFASDVAMPTRETQYWEMLGHRAIWHKGWKAVTEHVPGTSFDADNWRLYDTTRDFSESRNVAAAHPQILRTLQELWWREAEANDVFPLDDRPLVELIDIRSPYGLPSQTRLELRPGNGHVPVASGLAGSDRSMLITVQLAGRRQGDQGVLVASGGSDGGYTLYVRDDRLAFEHHALGNRVTCVADRPLPSGDSAPGVRLERRDDGSAAVTLLHGDIAVGKAELPHTHRHLSFRGLDVGKDTGRPVSSAYSGEFQFPSLVLDHVVIEFLSTPSPAEWAAAIEHSE